MAVGSLCGGEEGTIIELIEATKRDTLLFIIISESLRKKKEVID
jgi:hypothetical protein